MIRIALLAGLCLALLLPAGELAVAQNSLLPNNGVLCPDFLPGCGNPRESVFHEHQIFTDWLPAAIDLLLIMASAVAVAICVAGGITIATAAQDEEARGRGVRMVAFAGLGLLLAMSAYLIIDVVARVPLPNESDITLTPEL